jgi:hypothetical protein
VAQGEDPEFKPQYGKKKKRERVKKICLTEDKIRYRSSKRI